MLDNRFFQLAGLALVMFTLACTGAEQHTGFKVALLSPGPVSDAGWNASAWEGLQRIKAELGAHVSQVETRVPAEFEASFREYGRMGYQLVFGHGFEFQDAAARVAKDFPETIFITTSGNTVRQNVAPMVFQLEQATYLAGALAAMMSKTGRIGGVGGIKIPPVQSTFAAFEAGARAVRPDIVVSFVYIGNWENVGAARQAALALIDQGCDLLIHNADAAAAGVFQAAVERDIYVFGTNKNQNHLEPGHVLASCVSDIPGAFVTMAEIVRDKKFEPKIYRLGMPEGIVSLELNPELSDRIPAKAHSLIDSLGQQIKASTLQVPGLL